MKVKIEQVNKYKVTIDGKEYDGFSCDGEWEGFLKFSGPEGELVVHDPKDTSFDDIFGVMFGAKKERPIEFSVVKITPGLLPDKANYENKNSKESDGKRC